MDLMQQLRADGTLLLFPEAIPKASGTLGAVLNWGKEALAQLLPELRKRRIAIVPFSISVETNAVAGTPPATILHRLLARAWTVSGERNVKLLGIGCLLEVAQFHNALSHSDEATFWGSLATAEGGTVWVLPSGPVVGSEQWEDAVNQTRRLMDL